MGYQNSGVCVYNSDGVIKTPNAGETITRVRRSQPEMKSQCFHYHADGVFQEFI